MSKLGNNSQLVSVDSNEKFNSMQKPKPIFAWGFKKVVKKYPTYSQPKKDTLICLCMI